MTGRPCVLFYVQHLRGVGHVFRASRIARALARAGAGVHLVWGGTRMPSIDLSGIGVTYLEPVKSPDDSYSELVDAQGRPVDDRLRAHRRDALLALFATLEPDILITEAYPFGRRQMRFELEPLVGAATKSATPPLRVASVRDIMQENRVAKRVRESLDIFNKHFDLLLVHGDPALIRIEETLQGAGEILDRVRYTGLVAPDPVDLEIPPSLRGRVVVSAGGGAFGHALTAAALDAMSLSKLFPSDWIVTVGPERSEAEFEALRRQAPPGMRVVRFIPDLARVFAFANVCVTMAGYNTVGDLLRARARAVIVPWSGGRETEQNRRAGALARRRLAVVLPDTRLSAETLAKAVDEAAAQEPAEAELDLGGAEKSAAILLDAWRARGNAN